MNRIWAYTVHSCPLSTNPSRQDKDVVPFFELVLMLSLDNACCERGFSAMNDIRTAKGNKLDKPVSHHVRKDALF